MAPVWRLVFLSGIACYLRDNDVINRIFGHRG